METASQQNNEVVRGQLPYYPDQDESSIRKSWFVPKGPTHQVQYSDGSMITSLVNQSSILSSGKSVKSIFFW